MSKILYSVIFIFIALLGIIFAVLNADLVNLNYYFDSKEIPLSLAIILSMFLGAILGVLASLSFMLRHRKEVSRLRKAVEVTEKEISNLRAIPIKNKH